jgi:hypothetical protein
VPSVSLTLSTDMRAVVARRLPDLAERVLDSRLCEFLRFLQLAAQVDASRLPIGVELDEIWHIFILETEEYAKLCSAAGRFVHHTVKEGDSARNDRLQLDDDLAFVVAYIDSFGEFHQAAIPLWPALSRLSAHLQMSVKELQLFAGRLAADKRSIEQPMASKTASD